MIKSKKQKDKMEKTKSYLSNQKVYNKCLRKSKRTKKLRKVTL
jgi:hypothetical protein